MRQSWGGEPLPPKRNASCDIASRTGHWSRENEWVDSPGQAGALYVFAWHGRSDERADQCDPEQWRFFVFAKQDLPRNQKSIGLARLKELAAPLWHRRA